MAYGLLLQAISHLFFSVRCHSSLCLRSSVEDQPSGSAAGGVVRVALTGLQRHVV